MALLRLQRQAGASHSLICAATLTYRYVPGAFSPSDRANSGIGAYSSTYYVHAVTVVFHRRVTGNGARYSRDALASP